MNMKVMEDNRVDFDISMPLIYLSDESNTPVDLAYKISSVTRLQVRLLADLSRDAW